MMKMNLNMEQKRGIWKMSDIGLSGAQFEINQELLREFDNALGKIQSNQVVNQSSVVSSILSVLEPIGQSISYQVSLSSTINQYNIIESLKKKVILNEKTDWQNYVVKLQEIIEKIKSNQIDLNKTEIGILNDIGDALNDECNRHYHNLRG